MRAPLLSGTLARDASASLDLLSRQFLRMPRRRVSSATLADGLPGVCLLHSVLERCFPHRGHAARAGSLLGAAFEHVATQPMSATLYTGFLGVAWCNDHLGGASDEDANEDIDATLIDRFAGFRRWPGHFDVIKGLVGAGAYAMQRRHRPSGAALLEQVLRLLEGLAEERKAGLVWCTQARLIPAAHRRGPAKQYVDVGLAHGTPGVAALLSHVVSSGVGGERVRELLRGCTSWLIAHELPREAESRFPYNVGRGMPRTAARTGWCYGDLSVAWSILLAARALGASRWETDALRIARDVARRDPIATGVVDTGLCHGAAGVAHMFHRFALATGDAELRGAARSWFERLLAMRLPRGGLAGYWTDVHGEPEPVAEIGFLTGAAGVGLALAAALGRAPPSWDSVLLLGEPASARA